MKKLFPDKRYLILQGLSIVLTLIYFFYTNGYQQTPVFISWLAALVLFLATTIYCGLHRRWIVLSFNLAMAILLFLSLMILPYSA